MDSFKENKDETLVQLSLLGNEKAYEELVLRHERSVKGTALKITADEFFADDAAQDAFVAAWVKLDRLECPQKFGSWVCTIAKNRAKDLLVCRKNAAADISLHLFEDKGRFSADESEPLETLVLQKFNEQERNQRLYEAVALLPEKLKTTLKMHYFDGLSLKEISEDLKIPEGTVKWRLSEGRRQLRKEYAVMENKHSELSFVQRVMQKVEQLKLWSLKNDKSGFEKDYWGTLREVERLENSRDKHRALSDVLMMGYWWLPGKKNDEQFRKIKKSAEESQNEEVLQFVVAREMEKLERPERMEFLKNKKIPYFRENGLQKALSFCWFWLGYDYVGENRVDDGIKAYKKVLEISEKDSVYYANAFAAINAEERILKSDYKDKSKVGISATAEAFKFVGGKTLFWQQPGYSRNETLDGSIFFNCSACDNTMPDETLKVGEPVESSDKNVTMCLRSKDCTVKTPAGIFEHCFYVTFEFQNDYYGLNYNETYFCPGFGIVKQKISRHSDLREWQLSSYKINGGKGLLPFCEGNRWNYTCKVERIDYDITNRFEVISADKEGAILAHDSVCAPLGYQENTFLGNILKARNEYCDEKGETLRDVLPCLEKAAALAETKRQKQHAAAALQVMKRILDTDEKRTPDCTEIGRWNFFNYFKVQNTNGRLTLLENRAYSFEWKRDMRFCGDEGCKAVFSDPYFMLLRNSGAVWNDAWVPGYHVKEERQDCGFCVTLSFEVLADETVTVAAGTFKDCRHIRYRAKGYTGGMHYYGGEKEYWFAKGVGLVKFSSTYKNDALKATYELTEYKKTGDGYFPIADGIFRRYEPTKIGNGWRAAVEYTYDCDDSGAVIFRNATGVQNRENYLADMAKIEK